KYKQYQWGLQEGIIKVKTFLKIMGQVSKKIQADEIYQTGEKPVNAYYPICLYLPHSFPAQKEKRNKAGAYGHVEYHIIKYGIDAGLQRINSFNIKRINGVIIMGKTTLFCT
ncbi:MAG: hypothetical protein ABUM51_03490, partial [Bacteroidota bacterium]